MIFNYDFENNVKMFQKCQVFNQEVPVKYHKFITENLNYLNKCSFDLKLSNLTKGYTYLNLRRIRTNDYDSKVNHYKNEERMYCVVK